MYGIILTSIAAAVTTYELNNNRGYGPVPASAATALFFSSVFYVLGTAGFITPQIAETLAIAAMGASFAGMSSSKVLPGSVWVAASGAVFSFVFLFSNPAFDGLGGGLGISACISVITARGMMHIFREAGTRNIRAHITRA